MLLAGEEHFTAMLEGLADTGNTPCSSRRGDYDAQSFVCGTRDLPAAFLPVPGDNRVSSLPGKGRLAVG